MSTWDTRHGPGLAPPGVAQDRAKVFRNLCRSSPWKWQSLRFEYLDRPLGPPAAAPSTGSEPESESASASASASASDEIVRAWLRRPGALRLEASSGAVLYSTTGINDSRDGLY